MHRWGKVDWNRRIKHGKGSKKSVGERKQDGTAKTRGYWSSMKTKYSRSFFKTYTHINEI